LLFLVFGQDFTADLRAVDGRDLGRFELPPRYDGYLVPIWPDPGELTVWPPRRAIARKDLSAFAQWADAKVLRRRQ
jgi:hypothetical protein